MSANAIKQIQKKAAPVLRKHGVIRSSVFGSIARGAAKKNSDIDILVEFPKYKSLLDLVDLKFKLEAVLKRKIDVLTYDSVHPLLKNSIFKNQKMIYEKRS